MQHRYKRVFWPKDKLEQPFWKEADTIYQRPLKCSNSLTL